MCYNFIHDNCVYARVFTFFCSDVEYDLLKMLILTRPIAACVSVVDRGTEQMPKLATICPVMD